MNTLTSADRHAVAYWDGSQTTGTLTANNAGFRQRMPDKENFNCVVDSVRYIVRRLTPTECARLQGFPDAWGHPDKLDSFTEEEYRFWVNVRNTHAAINGKTVKEYTEAQMLTWYNKLHTDSAEYKMWGNGIALPPALYVMQGIAKTLRKQWLDDLLGVGDS
jgi:DNA (cytosine-5)-methyltransferase 1